MSLDTQIQNLVTRVATESKSLRTLINGNVADLSGLTTTAKGNLVLAINEVKASATGSPPDATATTKGVVELSTDAEAITGADTVRAVTPANVAAVFADRIDTNTALGTSNTKVASQGATKAYVDALLAAANAMVFRGVIDASTNPNYPAANAGDVYRISVAGKIGGAAGPNVEVGDTILCISDGSAAGTHAAVGANWNITQVNVDGAVTGPASSTNGNLASFSGTGGKVIADSGFSVDNDSALAANSSVRVPTQAAVRAYAQPLDADLTALAALVSAANKMPYATGAGTWALADLSVFARTLLDDADAATARATLSVYSQAEIGPINTDYVTLFNSGLA